MSRSLGSMPGSSARTVTSVSLSDTSNAGLQRPHEATESLSAPNGSRRNESNKRLTSERNSAIGDERPSGVSADLLFHGTRLMSNLLCCVEMPKAVAHFDL